MHSPNSPPDGRTLRVAGPAAAAFRPAVPRVVDLDRLSAHAQRILVGLLTGPGWRQCYGPLDWAPRPDGILSVGSDWHSEVRRPDAAHRQEWGERPGDWPLLCATCSPGAALSGALWLDAGTSAKERWGRSTTTALRGAKKPPTAPDHWLVGRAVWRAGRNRWRRNLTWRSLARDGLPEFELGERVFWAWAIAAGHVVTVIDCDRLRVSAPGTMVLCGGLWVLAWDGSYYDEAWDPVGRRWVEATKQTKARKWRVRRIYSCQPTRFEPVSARAAREPRVCPPKRRFTLVGLRPPNPVPATLRLVVEPRGAAALPVA